MSAGNIVGPLIVIVVGLVFLLRNLGVDLPFGVHIFRDFWWMLIIGVGLAQIAGGLVGRPGSIFAGIIVTTVGLLFGVQSLAGWHFGQTWPVLLIVVGAVGLLRAVAGPALSLGRAGRRGWQR